MKDEYIIVRVDSRLIPAVLSYWTHGTSGDNTTASRWTSFRTSASVYSRKTDAISTAKHLNTVFPGVVKVNTLRSSLTVWSNAQ